MKMGRRRIKRTSLPGKVRFENGQVSCVYYTAPEFSVKFGLILVDKNF